MRVQKIRNERDAQGKLAHKFAHCPVRGDYPGIMSADHSRRYAHEGPATATGVRLFVPVPSPSPPAVPCPQQTARLSVVTAQLWWEPWVTCRNRYPPATGTGVSRSVVVPSPSWPSPLKP